jgi:hypothetical protein
MVFGFTYSELGLVVFIFALVYGAVWVPKIGERIAILLHRPPRG